MTTTPDRFASPARAGTHQSAHGGLFRHRACLVLSLAGAIVWAFACDDPSPQACGSIAPQTTYVGQETFVSPCFEHPEMVELTLAAVSSNPGVATTEILEDRKLLIVAVSPGTAVITVTATAPDGLTGELTFEALVPNQPPRLREDEDGNVVELPALRLVVGDPRVVVVLSEYFVDPDGQELAYGATSTDTTRVSVGVAADWLLVTGVSAGAATVAVTATDPGGLSYTANVRALALERPGAPTGFTATLYADERGATDSAVLAWKPPENGWGTELTRYKVYWRYESFDPGRWRHIRNVDPANTRTPVTFGYDVPGYSYFRVSAVNEVGEGEPSNADSVFVVFHWRPEPPRLTARKAANQIYLQWEPSPNDTATIRQWRIDGSRDGSEWDVYHTPPWHLRARLYGVPTTADSLRFRILARYEGGGGSGEWSNVVRYTWRGPDQPTDFVAAADGDSAIVLTWRAPGDPGRSAITGYMIETSSEGGFNWRYLVTNTGSTATTYRHGNLVGGSTHLYAVSAVTETGIGPPEIAGATTEMNANARLDPSTPVRLILPGSKREHIP